MIFNGMITVLGFCMLVSMSALAEEFEYEGIKYSSLTDSTAQVGRNSNVQGDIVIPEYVDFNGKRLKVTAIGDYAFYDRQWNDLGITSIQFPNGLTSIGSYAFCNHWKLKAIDIPETVETMGVGALSHTGLETVELRHTPKDVQNAVFSDCDSLERAVMPGDMAALPGGIFMRCKNLKEVILPATMTTIGGSAFKECTALESLRTAAPDGETVAGFMLPDSLKVLEGGAFEGCTSLREIALPAKLTTLSSSCFMNCTGLRSITIPSSVTSFGDYLFIGCTALEEINWDDVAITAITEQMFKNCTRLRQIDIPASVTRIKANAFESSGLQSVVLGGSIETISREAFIGCNSLEDVYLRTDKLDKCYGTIFPPASFFFGTLHVPEGQKNKYKYLDFWKSFENIVEENTSGTEYCLIDVKTNYYDTYVNDEEIFLETHQEQPKGSPLTVRFTFNKNMFGDGYVRYLRGMQVNGMERIQDCTDGTLTISEVTEDLDITVDIGVYDASLAIYQDEHGGLEVLCEPNAETNVTIMPAEGYRADVTVGPWMKTYQWGNPWKETYTASDNDPLSLRLWLRDDEEIKIKYVKK